MSSASEYEAGLLGVRPRDLSTGRLATYCFGNEIATMHQDTFRARSHEPVAGRVSMAQFVSEFLADTMQQVGP